MSWKAEVVADDSGKFCSNLLRFATEVEALAYADDLSWRWTLVTRKRVVETSDPVTAEWTSAGVRHLSISATP